MMSGQETLSQYFSVSCSPFDTPGDGALLASALRSWFLTGKTVGGSRRAVESGREVRVRCRVGGGCFRWRKTSGRATLQESFPVAGGSYRLVSHDLLGRLASVSAFDGSLRWLQTAYYDGDPSKPAAVLIRNRRAISLLECDPRAGRYRRSELFPCPAEPGTAAQSYIDKAAGEPRVLARTDAGDFCFCTEEECAARASLREKLRNHADALIPDWPEGKDAPLDFHVIPNDGGGGCPAAGASADRGRSAPSAEGPLQAEQPSVGERSADAERQTAADLPPAPIGEFAPGGGPVPGDYAADHEIFRSDGGSAPDGGSVPGGGSAPGGGSVPGPAVPASTKYAVAAKGLSGGVVHAAGLGKSAAPREASGPAGLIPAKRIVVSSMESYQYFGRLLDGLREGRGRTQMLNGHTAYEGGYHADKRDGFGVYYYKSGKLCYAGGWRRNLRDGMGVAFGSRDGSIFVGHWQNGVATGSGSAFDMAGNLVYTGGWRDGKRHGHGTEYRAGRIVRVGEWKEDRFCSGYSRVGGRPGDGGTSAGDCGS